MLLLSEDSSDEDMAADVAVFDADVLSEASLIVVICTVNVILTLHLF